MGLTIQEANRLSKLPYDCIQEEYPTRVGEHTNTAFGLSLAYEYAQATKNGDLEGLIKSKSYGWFQQDMDCPLTWEPSGFDFFLLVSRNWMS
jgi:hypothetical protein